jgi:DNA-binding MltR family transcriptional regulator
LVAASFIDQRLREILSAFMIHVPDLDDLFEGPAAALGTLAARSTAAFALGLIQENEHSEITLLRRIRNEFGHKWKDVDFESGKVAALVDQLRWLGPSEYESTANRRARFNAAVAILMVDLMWRVQLVEKEKRTPKVWPSRARQG